MPGASESGQQSKEIYESAYQVEAVAELLQSNDLKRVIELFGENALKSGSLQELVFRRVCASLLGLSLTSNNHAIENYQRTVLTKLRELPVEDSFLHKLAVACFNMLMGRCCQLCPVSEEHYTEASIEFFTIVSNRGGGEAGLGASISLYSKGYRQ